MFEVFEIELGIKMNCNDMKLIVNRPDILYKRK